MAERDGVGGQPNQLGPFGWFKVLEPEADSLDSFEHHAEFTGVLRGGHQQRQPGARGQPLHLGAERVRYAAAGGGQRGRNRGRPTADQITRAQRRGKFDERQRVSAGFLDQPVTLVRLEIGGPLGEQCRGGRLTESAQWQHSQVAEVGDVVADRDQQYNAFRAEPPPSKQQHIPRFPVASPVRNRSAPGASARPNAARSADA
jgi:hypothetical protein